jgi:D-alanyl-D-alanine carboxypeptidase
MPSILPLILAFHSVQAEPLHVRVEAKLKELHAAADFPGMTAAFVLPSGDFVQLGIGLADAQAKTPMRASDRMFSGSIGKTYVAALAMQLVKEAKLNLDDPLSKHLGSKPYFDRIPNARSLIVRHLMNHTSGISEHVLNPAFLKAMKDDPDRTFTPDQLAEYALDAKPLFEAGKGWSYADTNFNFLGLVIESVTGKPIFKEIESRLLGPLQLRQTTPSDGRTPRGLIQGHSMPNSPFGFSGPVIKEGKYPFNPQMEYCGGGFVSTSLDLALWAKALFEGKAFDLALMPEMLTGEKANTGPNERYGLGVQIRPSEWGETLGHSGWFPGYLSDMAYFPHRKFSVAVQFNTDHMARLKLRPYRFLLEIAKLIEAELAKSSPTSP